MQLTLARTWFVDENQALGVGAFGTVYAAEDGDGKRAAVKFVPKTPGATRDLLAASLPASPHLVPIIDIGETEDSWALVMPRADYSLRDRMNQSSPIELPEALYILQSIAQGLVDLGGAVVHRDLKPENVLNVEGEWAISDFGIARYAAASTAPDTQKYSMTPGYAAPEQWRLERSTVATDVYALGVLGYELCVGSRPFDGRSRDELRQQHLEQAPPQASQLPQRLQALLGECLYKPAGARPTPSNFVARVSKAGEAIRRPGAAALAEAQRLAVDQIAEQTMQADRSRTEQERRAALLGVATASHRLIIDELIEALREEAPAIQVQRGTKGEVRASLLSGVVRILGVQPSNGKPFDAYGVDLDVIAYSGLEVEQSGRGLYRRSHSLYYCNFEEPEQYAWYELAFMELSFSRQVDMSHAPIALSPGNEAAGALSSTMTSYQLGRPFVPLRPGELDDFIDRWSSYLARASQGRLSYPNTLPEGIIQNPRRASRGR